jgi:uncharacterized protein DUF2332
MSRSGSARSLRFANRSEMLELDAVRRRYRQFADAECRRSSDLYYRLLLRHPFGFGVRSPTRHRWSCRLRRSYGVETSTSRRLTSTTMMRSGGCWHASGRIIRIAANALKRRSRARSDPPYVVRGDLVDDLAMLLAEAPPDARLVVFHSAVLGYVSAERRTAFAPVLAGASNDREIVWVSNEAPGVVSKPAASPPPGVELRFSVACTIFRRGVGADELLALVHPHGSEMTCARKSADQAVSGDPKLRGKRYADRTGSHHCSVASQSSFGEASGRAS